ncbi:Gfo/Idh/MocA family oxidoreductase [uncultured Clostridium sp.]|uniref:Gfo/Idh/MocA family protein n=1 Tax=uncultured Clostridium sp. TaxID=59620 RepID=UPI0028EAA93F|nr:Gfo/Idh/MocA family oxidoreductase [uncultured Clostridium sp.]
MDKLNIGILGPSDVAFRKFLPALKTNKYFEYAGVAVANLYERNQVCNNNENLPSVIEKSKIKSENIKKEYGGKIFYSYEELINSNNIEAIYISLPPALHYFWAKKALEHEKHVLLEKPFTTNLVDTMSLIKIAGEKKLALHENYAFCYHNQINTICELIDRKEIGEIRQIRAAFGFPYREANDFRYNRELGGGALLDCGGYPIKLATLLLGKTAQIKTAKLNTVKGHDVDIFGSATLENCDGVTVQVSFGMDNVYKCEMEIWGSQGVIYAPRIFTAPADVKSTIISKKEEEKIIEIPKMDQFLGSINHFYDCIVDDNVRLRSYKEIEIQSKHINDIFSLNKGGVK